MNDRNAMDTLKLMWDVCPAWWTFLGLCGIAVTIGWIRVALMWRNVAKMNRQVEKFRRGGNAT